MNLLSKNLKCQTMLQKLPDITFLAEALDDPFTYISIVTLRSHVATQVEHDMYWLDKQVDSTIEAKQFVRVEPERIVIAVNVEKVDDMAIDVALLSLMEANLSTGYYEFGETITYNRSELLNDTNIN